MDEPYDFDALAERPVEDDELGEVLHRKHSSVSQQPVLDLRDSAETRVGQEQPECFVGHVIEVESGFKARVRC